VAVGVTRECFVRPLSPILLAALFLVPAPARAQVAVVTARSADTLVPDLDYVASLVLPEAEYKALETSLKPVKGDLERGGVDGKRPLGVYVNWPDKITDLDSLEIPIVFFVPVADQKRFLALVEELGSKPQKGEGDTYGFELKGVPPHHLRFAHGYAFVSLNPANLAGKLPDPATLVPAGGQKSTITAVLHVDRFPKEYRRLIEVILQPAVPYFEGMLGSADRLPGESEAEFRRRQKIRRQAKALPRVVQAMLAEVIEQVGTVSVDLDLERRQSRLALNVAVVPRGDNALASFSRYAGRAQGRFGYLASGAQLSVLLHLPGLEKFPPSGAVPQELPEAARQFFPPQQQEAILKLIHVLVPTIATDGLDACLVVPAASKEEEEVMLAGLKVRNGRKLDQLLRDLFKNLPRAEKDDYAVKWNHARHGQARIHRVDKLFGEKAEAYLAIRDDVVFFALGEQGLKVVTKALDGFDEARPSPSPVFQLDVASAFFLEGKTFADELKVVPPAERSKLHARVSLEGGKDLRLRVEMNAYLLKLLARIGEE
jgi:hypothetical protein